MSSVVSFFVITGTLGSLLFFFLILHFNRTSGTTGKTTGHNYDGIEEYDNPLPAWWYWLFVLSIVYSLGYLIYYPGLGNCPGIAGWTSQNELEISEQVAQERYGPIFQQYKDIPLGELSQNSDANKMGRRLFANNCAACHGATGQGSYGFPNLTDQEWLWGGDDVSLETTILNGRTAVMIPWGPILGDDGVEQAAEFVMKLAGREVDDQLAEAGETHYKNYCVACHGAQGKGQVIFGAPDLTNEIWLYGNSKLQIQDSIRSGRNGQMPGFEDKLGPEKVHILAAYVRSLSKQPVH